MITIIIADKKQKTESFYMLLIYSKSKKDDLSQDQLQILSQLVKPEGPARALLKVAAINPKALEEALTA